MSQLPPTTTVPPNEPKTHKHKAETLEQSPPVTCKPHKLIAVTTKTAVTLPLLQKVAILMPMTIVANSEIEESLSSDKDFFVKNVLDKAFTWTVTTQKLKSHHIITGNIYPDD